VLTLLSTAPRCTQRRNPMEPHWPTWSLAGIRRP